jgi:hypothetical protein
MSNFILTLPLKTQIYQEDILNKRFNIARQLYNACLGYLYEQYNIMIETKEYKNIERMAKGKDRNKQFQELNSKQGLTEYSLHEYIKPMQHHFKGNIDSFTAQKIATRCFDAFKKYMLHSAKKVYFKKYDELDSVEGKSNKTGIKFRDNQLIWNELTIPVIIKKNNIYAQEALENPIKFCRVKREMIKGKYHYYIQLILEGVSPIKFDKETGEIKNQTTIGKVGIDIGTQTIAISSNYDVKLLELAPEINKIDREIKLIQRYMDRSRRASNPNKFNENGTINTKNKDKWVYSKRYVKARNERKELFRKQREIRKQSHNKLANQLIILGNELYVETMNYKGLQVRAKKTTINEKTGKINKKKRYGKSLANKAPSMFLTILDNKLKFQNNNLNRIDTFSVKASQYNHITNEYIKKSLSERWNNFGEYKIQRDLYSAFLIMCVKNNLKEVDKDLCFKYFDNFKIMHDEEIDRIKTSNNKVVSSMGL